METVGSVGSTGVWVRATHPVNSSSFPPPTTDFTYKLCVSWVLYPPSPVLFTEIGVLLLLVRSSNTDSCFGLLFQTSAWMTNVYFNRLHRKLNLQLPIHSSW